jgi:hypothetical protein
MLKTKSVWAPIDRSQEPNDQESWPEIHASSNQAIGKEGERHASLPLCRGSSAVSSARLTGAHCERWRVSAVPLGAREPFLT